MFTIWDFCKMLLLAFDNRYGNWSTFDVVKGRLDAYVESGAVAYYRLSSARRDGYETPLPPGSRRVQGVIRFRYSVSDDLNVINGLGNFDRYEDLQEYARLITVQAQSNDGTPYLEGGFDFLMEADDVEEMQDAWSESGWDLPVIEVANVVVEGTVVSDDDSVENFPEAAMRDVRRRLFDDEDIDEYLESPFSQDLGGLELEFEFDIADEPWLCDWMENNGY